MISVPLNLHPYSHTYCAHFRYAAHLALRLFSLFYSEINPAWFATILVLLSLNYLSRNPPRTVHILQVLRCLELSTEFLTKSCKSYAKIITSFLHDFML